MSRASLPDIDIAVSNLHRAVDRLVAVCGGVQVSPPTSRVPAEVEEMQRRVIATRMWTLDPQGIRANIGLREYAEAHGL